MRNLNAPPDRQLKNAERMIDHVVDAGVVSALVVITVDVVDAVTVTVQPSPTGDLPMCFCIFRR